jgi:hypothetical protein
MSLLIGEYIICPYCKILTNEIEHPNRCIPEESETLLCYTCFKPNKSYSSKQLTKGVMAKCKDCVEDGKTTRYTRYGLYYGSSWGSGPFTFNVNKKLYFFAGELEVEKVRNLLEAGADPNYIRQKTISSNVVPGYKEVYVYNKHGEVIPDLEPNQPTTPLKYVIFRVGHPDIQQNYSEEIIEIIKLLLEKGANRQEGLDYFNNRYCLDEPKGIFWDVYNLLA